MKKINIILLILFFGLILTLLLRNTFAYHDPDLGWHLRIGQQILEERSVPELEKHLFPILGKNWLDHEWLANLLSFYLYDNFGHAGLGLFYSLIALAIFIMLYRFGLRLGAGRIMLIILLFFIYRAAVPSLGIRVQEFTALFLLGLLILVWAYQRTSKIKYLLAWPVLFYVWANLHGGFLAGFFLLGLFILYQLLIRVPKINQSPFLRSCFTINTMPAKNVRLVFLAALASLAATLFTPYGLGLYSFLSSYGQDTYYFTHILEWLPAWYEPIIIWQLIYFALTIAFGLIYFLDLRSSRDERGAKADLWDFLLALVFLAMAIKARRHFILFAICSLPWLVAVMRQLFVLPEHYQTIFKQKILYFFAFSALALSLILASLTSNINGGGFTDQTTCAAFPCAAIDFLKSDPKFLDKKLFNEYNWGGFLSWVWPEKLLFIDGRLPMYMISDKSYLEEYHQFFIEDEVAGKLDEYGLELVLTKKIRPVRISWWEKVFFGKKPPEPDQPDNELIKYLEASPGWQKIYEDKISLIYEKL